MAQNREQRTIRAMVDIYCRAHHGAGEELCDECRDLFEYALARLGKCPFGPEKPVCAKCPIHCYRADMREQIRVVMQFAGPRMALRHPGLAVAHLLQKQKPVPARQRKTPPSVAEEHGERCPECGDPQD